MAKNRLSAFLFLLILPFLIGSTTTFAEDESGPHDGDSARREADGAPPKGTPRPPADPVSGLIFEFFEKNFGLTKKYYEDKYKDDLAKAIQGVRLKPDFDKEAEKFFGKTTAQLFGTLNDKQYEMLAKELADRRKEIEEKTTKTGADEQMLDVIKRLQWGLKIKKPDLVKDLTPPEDRFASFREGFSAEDAIVEKNNKEFHDRKKELLDLKKKLDAATGAEKVALQKEFDEKRGKFAADFDEINSFNDFNNDEKRGGIAQLSQDLSTLLANQNGKSHFYEGTDPVSGKTYRVDLGEDPTKFNRALADGKAELAKQGVSLRGSRPSTTPIASPSVSVRPEFLGPRPADALPKDPPPSTEPAKELKDFAALMKKAGCVNCHGPGGSASERFDSNGVLKDKSEAERDKFINLFLANNKGPAGMKRAIDEIRKNEADRKAVEAWAKFRGKEITVPVPTASLDPVRALPGDVPKSLTAALAGGFAKEKVSPDTFASELAKGALPSHILDVGDVGKIKGSTTVGPLLSGDEWMAKFNSWELANPDARNQPIAVYCGCCDAETCPNLLPALALLRSRGYTNVRAVEMNNFDEDWRDKGYPTS